MSTFEEAVQDIKKAKSVLENQPAEVADVIKHPDPTKHKYISFVKSGFRILAGIALCFGEFIIAGLLLIVAELLGIAEELV
jgi:hypothetical protein